jgi:hypothetical protein
MFKVLGLVSLFALTACGSGSSKKEARPPQHSGNGASTGFDLQGIGASTGISSCLISSDEKTSAIIGYQMEDVRMARTTKVFDGSVCAPDELYAIKVATYDETRISDTNEVPGGKLIKSFFGSMTFSPEKDSFTTTLNETAVYGFKDWVTKTPKVVSGLKYDNETKAEWSAGKGVELIYKVENDKLFFAYFDDNNAPYFDEKVFHTKQ